MKYLCASKLGPNGCSVDQGADELVLRGKSLQGFRELHAPMLVYFDSWALPPLLSALIVTVYTEGLTSESWPVHYSLQPVSM